MAPRNPYNENPYRGDNPYGQDPYKENTESAGARAGRFLFDAAAAISQGADELAKQRKTNKQRKRIETEIELQKLEMWRKRQRMELRQEKMALFRDQIKSFMPPPAQPRMQAPMHPQFQQQVPPPAPAPQRIHTGLQIIPGTPILSDAEAVVRAFMYQNSSLFSPAVHELFAIERVTPAMFDDTVVEMLNEFYDFPEQNRRTIIQNVINHRAKMPKPNKNLPQPDSGTNYRMIQDWKPLSFDEDDSDKSS
ncbi:MAG: hypothetical protein Q3962_00595 [Corynebacterium sp.]|nr:hypothetical protein [Corynebacterium sp.]